jgi:hypothetical protein
MPTYAEQMFKVKGGRSCIRGGKIGQILEDGPGLEGGGTKVFKRKERQLDVLMKIQTHI